MLEHIKHIFIWENESSGRQFQRKEQIFSTFMIFLSGEKFSILFASSKHGAAFNGLMIQKVYSDFTSRPFHRAENWKRNLANLSVSRSKWEQDGDVVTSWQSATAKCKTELINFYLV